MKLVFVLSIVLISEYSARNDASVTLEGVSVLNIRYFIFLAVLKRSLINIITACSFFQ